MLRSAARIGGLGALTIALTLLAAPAGSAPLGLQPGDEVTSIEWDALKSVSGDGGTYDVSLGSKGGFFGDGRVNSTTVVGPETRFPSGDVELRFDLDLVSDDTFVNTTTGKAFANAFFSGAAAVTPDFVMREDGVNILFGNFSTLVQISGNVNLASNEVDATQTLVGRIAITGGATNLVNALGGAGSAANLIVTGSIFDFTPVLANLAADGNVFNENFTVSMSGTLIPLANAPFVPEPSTAVLFAGGMLGLLGLSRRAGRRRP